MRRFNQFGIPLKTASGEDYTSSLPFVDLVYTGAINTHLIDNSEIGRLDLIAAKWWPNQPDACDYADIIAWYNNIDDQIGEVQAGKILMIPVDAVYDTRLIKAFTYVEKR